MNRIVKLVSLILLVVVGAQLAAEPAELTEQQRQELEAKAAALNQQAAQCYHRGEIAAGVSLAQTALRARQALYPKEKYPQGHPLLVQSLTNLGVLYEVQGEYAKSERVAREAVAMCRALYPKDKYPQGHSDLAYCLNNLGVLAQSQKNFAEAEALYRESLAQTQALFPRDKFPQGHPLIARRLNNLGTLLDLLGQYDKAEPLLLDALAMSRGLYPKDKYPQGHLDLAKALNYLGLLYEAQALHDKAEPHFREALAMRQALYPRNEFPQGHRDLAESLTNMGAIYRSRNEYAKAEPFKREALAIHEALFARLADSASEAEALNFAASLPFPRDSFLSITRLLPPQPATYDLLWQTRATATRVVERRHLDMMANRDATCQKLFQELQAARQRLAQQLLAPSGNAKLVRELTEQKEELEKRLVRQLRVSQPAQVSTRTPGQLAERLPEGTAFVDFIRYIDISEDPQHPGTRGLRYIPHYVAFVLCRGKPAVRVNLGEAAPIEKAWAAWHQALTKGSPDRAAAAEVAALVWQPVRAKLPAQTTTIWLAPDGRLTGIPWTALPGQKADTMLLEDHAIALVPHGHFLLQALEKTEAPRGTDTLLAVGGVAYDRAPKGQAPDEKAAPPVGNTKVFWGDLPGTERERRQIVELAAKVKINTIERSGDAASVAQVLQDLPRVRYAHLATHGFFADPKFRSALQIDERNFVRYGQERSAAGARSPLVLSGVVFAGANRPETPDRGILTAESVVGLRLDDMELAVLSACETGLGEVAGGEGVFGLTRAFHVAGTRTVVASLWHVPDLATQVLMEQFYTNLWQKKMTKLEALRAAQLWMLREGKNHPGLARGMVREDAPDKTGRLPAYFWAAFMMSGLGK